MDAPIPVGHSVCPHDCPSTCALDVELLGDGRIGRVRGAKGNDYTAGVICAKVARYAERIHHPDRLLHPLRRTGPKGTGQFQRISWDEALERVGDAFNAAEREFGAASVWPYYYAGTMGLLMRDGIERLTHAKKYSRFHSTICVGTSFPGAKAGPGALWGPDPREMAKSDLIVLWGTNPVNTQVNVMTHAARARKERGAKIAAVDIYRNGTMEQADVAMCIRPGTDGALAAAVMHVLFREGFADRDYLATYADDPEGLEAHLATRTPDWASALTGLPVAEIEAFARLIGSTKRTYFRLGYGFTRSRNGAANMHAVSCIPVVTGAWAHEGGGALHSLSGIYQWDKTLIQGLDSCDLSVRAIDQSRIGAALTGDPYDLAGGPPVKAMLIQSTNPMEVAPDQNKVRAGFSREDLFTCVHEQFMTSTAKMADIVLPATMFLEHDDIYQASGHPHIQLGPKLVQQPGECRSNHEVICGIAGRVGAVHRGFGMSPREIIGWTLEASSYAGLEELERRHWIDVMPPFRKAHFLDGFAWPDGKFRLKADWAGMAAKEGFKGDVPAMPGFPDHWAVTEEADEAHPFRLATSPARGYLNSTFNETETSREKHGPPHALIHPEDLKMLGVANGGAIRIGNKRGEIALVAKTFPGLQRGVVIIESIAPNTQFAGGAGVNTLTGAEQSAPHGGAPFHDNRVWVQRVAG
jgi:anaerobic selenocysteine-containing dehydrogenase